jgi:type I restriction enzyme S subunit
MNAIVEPSSRPRNGKLNDGAIATGWRESKLGELLTIVRGVSYKKEHASGPPAPDLVPILRATNIQNGLVFEDFVHVPRRYVSDDQLLRKGDIVVAASSGSRNIVGKAAQLTVDWFGSFGTFCFGLRPKPGVEPGYLGWFLQTSEYRNRVSELSAGVNINNLRATHIEEIPIRIAPLPEQRRIVAEIEKQFTRLEVGVAALRRVQANLKSYRAAALKAAWEGRLVPTEADLARAEDRKFENGDKLIARFLTERRRNWQGRGQYKEPATPVTANLPTIPEGWTWATVEQLLREGLCNGVSVKGSDSPPGVRALRLSAMSNSGFDYSDARYLPLAESDVDDLWIQEGDFFMSRGNGSLHLVGRGTSAQKPPRPTIFPDTMIRLRLTDAVRISGWVRMLWPSRLVRGQIETRVKTTAGIYKIAQPQVEEIVIPLPPLAEQKRIVVELERRFSVVQDLEAVASTNLKRSTRLKQSILSRAFVGEI